MDTLTLTQRKQPQLKAGEVLIKMLADSLNHCNLLTVKGTYNSKQQLPLVLFSDGVGEVLEVEKVGLLPFKLFAIHQQALDSKEKL